MRVTSCITEELLASQEGLSPFYLVCKYDICLGTSRRMQAFLALICCARRHNKRNTVYLELYAWVERRNASRSLCKMSVFVLNRFLTKIWCLSTNMSKILLCHISRAFVERLLSRRLRPDRRKTTFRPKTDSIYDGGPIRLYHNTTVLQLPTVFSTVTCCTGL
jgi:hypothetical protein